MFGRIVGKLQVSPDSLEASHFFVFSFIVLEQQHKRARENREFVLSVLILRDHLYYACVYVWHGYIQKPPSILCAKLQHEARKHYSPSEVAMRLQLLCKHSNTGTTTRLGMFTLA